MYLKKILITTKGYFQKIKPKVVRLHPTLDSNYIWCYYYVCTWSTVNFILFYVVHGQFSIIVCSLRSSFYWNLKDTKSEIFFQLKKQLKM